MMNDQIEFFAFKIASLNKEQHDLKVRYLQINSEILHILEKIANIAKTSYEEFTMPFAEKSSDIISMYEVKEESKQTCLPKKTEISLELKSEETNNMPKRRGRPKKNHFQNQSEYESFDKMILAILSDPSNYPKDKKGLKLTEINDIILKNKMWNFDDINSMKKIQNVIYQLKDAGKIKRSDQDRRYYISNHV